MTLSELTEKIKPANTQAAAHCKARWDSIAKPLGGLGQLETAIIRIAGMTGNPEVQITKRCCVVMCADNGVVAEGVTQTGQEVTAIVAENMTRGETSVCAMGRVANCRIIPVDIGVACPVSGNGLVVHKVASGTQNFAQGPAMTRDQALDALLFGASLAQNLAEQGYQIIATGEMGIGNTTSAGAVTCALLGLPAQEIAGRGAGLDNAGLLRKQAVIAQALNINQPDPDDPIDLLSKVGGYDIAGLCGVFLGCAASRIPVVIDGAISAAAAQLAAKICPAAKDYMLASHLSKEPMSRKLLESLGLSAPITADFCLGEGTGAVALLPMLDLALSVYREMRTFSEISIEDYKPFERDTPC